MLLTSLENHRRQGYEQNVTRVLGKIAHSSDEHHHGRHQLVGGNLNGLADQAVEPAGILRDTDTKHNGEHHSQRLVTHEVVDHIAEHVPQAADAEQVHDIDRGLLDLHRFCVVNLSRSAPPQRGSDP